MACEVLEVARGYVAAGLSVIPVRADGTKAPAFGGWREYSARRPDDATLSGWFAGRARYGLGVPGGPASGNLAVMDFETGAAWDRWRSGLTPDLAAAADACPLARTPGGGAHLYARLPEPVKGLVLARRVDNGRIRPLVEVRAEGEQVVAPGSPPECHPSGRPYRWERAAWVDTRHSETAGWETWLGWLDAAAAMSEVGPPDRQPAPDSRDRRTPSDDDPGRDFNRRGTWEQAGLFAHGWRWCRSYGDDRGTVTRPDKAEGTSGTVGVCHSRENGWPLFYCFTSSAYPFEPGACYDRFGVFARLYHGGDFTAAASALAAVGFGRRKPPARPGRDYDGDQLAALTKKVNELALRVRKLETGRA